MGIYIEYKRDVGVAGRFTNALRSSPPPRACTGVRSSPSEQPPPPLPIPGEPRSAPRCARSPPLPVPAVPQSPFPVPAIPAPCPRCPSPLAPRCPRCPRSRRSPRAAPSAGPAGPLALIGPGAAEAAPQERDEPALTRPARLRGEGARGQAGGGGKSGAGAWPGNGQRARAAPWVPPAPPAGRARPGARAALPQGGCGAGMAAGTIPGERRFSGCLAHLHPGRLLNSGPRGR
ncbi:basic proline-rich protein-like [Molothrus ater]|uniref:basic proline-rich protein-like n=1 Tax=Molothrus ater TaxID=84834 RepID=UPI001749ED16|nr:basic proline-rich protein-like [Molothrus ater]